MKCGLTYPNLTTCWFYLTFPGLLSQVYSFIFNLCTPLLSFSFHLIQREPILVEELPCLTFSFWPIKKNLFKKEIVQKELAQKILVQNELVQNFVLKDSKLKLPIHPEKKTGEWQPKRKEKVNLSFFKSCQTLLKAIK